MPADRRVPSITKQYSLNEKDWLNNLKKLNEMIDNSKMSENAKLGLKDSLERIILKEIKKAPLILKKEIECRNCKNIILYLDKPVDISRTMYDLFRCPRCGQILDWEELREKIAKTNEKISKKEK